MKVHFIEEASKVIPDSQILINVVSQRVAQLNAGRSPLVPTTPHMGAGDIALQEIIAGKIVWRALKPGEDRFSAVAAASAAAALAVEELATEEGKADFPFGE